MGNVEQNVQKIVQELSIQSKSNHRKEVKRMQLVEQHVIDRRDPPAA